MSAKKKPQAKRIAKNRKIAKPARRPAPNAGQAVDEDFTTDTGAPQGGSWLPDAEIAEDWGNQQLGPHFL